MTVTFIRWKDAVAEEAKDGGEACAKLAELTEIGFLLHETDEAVVIGMEGPQRGEIEPGRWRLHIPKVSIVERRDVTVDRAFPVKKTRKVKGQ